MFSESDLALHHVGYLVKDIPSAAAYYCELLGYRIESAVIEDVRQTAQVQFLRQPGASSWLELVSPACADSKLAAALQKGVTLHHLCYEVADMERACQHFRAKGCFPVGEPTPATAFPNRRIAWFMDARRLLIELLENGEGALSLASLKKSSL